MQQSNHDTLSDVIVQEERCAYTHSQKISIRGRGECVRCFQQHKFNNENRIVCVWEAQLVKAVSLNLSHPYPHVIPVLSHFLPLCTEKIISKHFNNYFEQPTLKAKWKIASRQQNWDNVLFSVWCLTYLRPWWWQEGVTQWKEQKKSWH